MMEHEGGDAIVPEEVVELLEERTRVRSWLEGLAELRSETTPAVYDKVRTDYEGRLEGVNARLTEHRSELESSVERHRSRVQKLQGERDAAAMKLEEAQLRHRVGEYAEAEWERRREEGESAIRDLDGTLGAEREALAKLEKIMGELVSGGATSQVSPPRSGAEEAPPEETLVKSWGRGLRGLANAEEGGAGAGAEPAGAERPGAAAPAEPRREGEGEGSPPPVRSAEPSVSGDGPADAEPARAREARNGDGLSGSEEPVDDEAADYLDELEFLESLSLDDEERFDAVSAMLDEEEEDGGEEGTEPEGERSP